METILKVDGVTKQYRKFKAVDNVSFELEKGNGFHSDKRFRKAEGSFHNIVCNNYKQVM